MSHYTHTVDYFLPREYPESMEPITWTELPISNTQIGTRGTPPPLKLPERPHGMTMAVWIEKAKTAERAYVQRLREEGYIR